MSAIDWDDLEHWGAPATCVHVSASGSHLDDRHTDGGHG